MWIRTTGHHFNLDKVTHTVILNNELHIYLVDTERIILKGEEAEQVIDYLDSIACPTWALLDEVLEPGIMKEYKEMRKADNF